MGWSKFYLSHLNKVLFLKTRHRSKNFEMIEITKLFRCVFNIYFNHAECLPWISFCKYFILKNITFSFLHDFQFMGSKPQELILICCSFTKMHNFWSSRNIKIVTWNFTLKVSYMKYCAWKPLNFCNNVGLWSWSMNIQWKSMICRTTFEFWRINVFVKILSNSHLSLMTKKSSMRRNEKLAFNFRVTKTFKIVK